MLTECFDSHRSSWLDAEPDEEEGVLKLEEVKAYFAKKERKSPFSEAEFMAHVQKMVDENKLFLSGDTLYTVT